MENKIAIVMAMTALMVAALAAPIVMADDVEYTVSVVTSDMVVAPINTAFGDLLAGASKELSSSLNLTNSGGAAADVDAKFTTNVSGLYGLVSGTDVIGAGNFSIGTDGNEDALNDAGSDTALGLNNQVPAGSSVYYDAILTVPASQAVGSYTGNVRLTFTAVT
jgi:hypothetical protein